jgi:Transposase, Mutator family
VAPTSCELLEGAEEDRIGVYAFSREHWTKIRSTNPLERVNKEIGRRSDVVGIFPNDQAVIGLAGALLLEQNDEWLVQRRYLLGRIDGLGSCPAHRPARRGRGGGAPCRLTPTVSRARAGPRSGSPYGPASSRIRPGSSPRRRSHSPRPEPPPTSPTSESVTPLQTT